jgi:hypothetical protein
MHTSCSDLTRITVAEPARFISLIVIMHTSIAISDREENDLSARGIWESEGGNPGRLQQLPGDKNEGLGLGEAPYRGLDMTAGVPN